MSGKYKKIIAPVIITALSALWFIFTACLILSDGLCAPVAGKIAAAAIPAAIAGVSIYVLIERIKEIKGGEEDDLSKY